MRLIFVTITSLALLISCRAQDKNRKAAFQWIAFENIPTDSVGKVTGTPSWRSPSRINLHTSDTFVIYGENRDSMLMTTPGNPEHEIYRKMKINASKWKPNPDYGHKLFFIGTYGAKDLPGLYFSFYSTKDWSSLLQIGYTNPGNMNMAMLFAKDSVNILKQYGIIIDPRDEASEPEKGEIILH
jgi:hypothetical protein